MERGVSWVFVCPVWSEEAAHYAVFEVEASEGEYLDFLRRNAIAVT